MSPSTPSANVTDEAPLDLGLVRKYSVPGPRYTSYPPATRFSASAREIDLPAALAEDNRSTERPLSLYVHLPFCESRCWYCGCNTVITRDQDRANPYLDYLEKELALLHPLIDRRRSVTQLHFGGGTPTFLAPEQLRRLGKMLREHFQFAADAEISVEIDPRRLSLPHIEALRDIGATRASLGVQDTNPEVQVAIHRHQPHALNEQAFAWLRGAGFCSINVDLIYGLPLQTPATITQTIRDVLQLSPDRLSVFSYAHVPWLKPAQKIFDQRGQLPDAEAKLAMFATAHAELRAAGYVDIGLDHFAKPNDELAQARDSGTLQRNFQGYSTRAGASLYGLGLSSISSTADVYYQNYKTLAEYRAALDAGRLPVERGLRLTAEDKRRREIIMGVMCERRLDYAQLSRKFGFDFAAHYATAIDSLQDLEADGILRRTANGLEITPRGAPLLRIVAMRFDPTDYSGAKQHSKTV